MTNYWICRDCYHSWDSTDRLVPLQCPNTNCNSKDLQYDFEAEQAERMHKTCSIEAIDRALKGRGTNKNTKEYDKYEYNEFGNKGKHYED
jgi:hypothetical protein